VRVTGINRIRDGRTAVRSHQRSILHDFATLEVILGCIALLAIVATQLYGTLGAFIFLLASASIAALRPVDAGRDLMRFAPLIILPLLAIASTAWSDAPERSLRAGLQLFCTIVAAILVCRRLKPETLILILFGAYCAMCMLAWSYVALGRMTVGLFGSKNQMGFAAQMLLALSLAVVVDRRQPKAARFATILAVPLSLFLLIVIQSAGARMSAAVTLITFPAFMIFARVKLPSRLGFMIATLALTGLALAFLPEVEAAWGDFRQNVLKKDGTLTGRTYLWDFADRLADERPLLGRGYYAFWRQGNVDAEGLWRWAGIGSRSGFNFHNALVEIRVDLGWIGVAVLLLTCAGIATAGIYRQVTRPSVSMAFLLSLTIAIYIRSYAESGIVYPFGTWTLLLIATAVYAFAPNESNPESELNALRYYSLTSRSRKFIARRFKSRNTS